MTTGRVFAASPSSASHTSPRRGLIELVQHFLLDRARPHQIKSITVRGVYDLGYQCTHSIRDFWFPFPEFRIELLRDRVHGSRNLSARHAPVNIARRAFVHVSRILIRVIRVHSPAVVVPRLRDVGGWLNGKIVSARAPLQRTRSDGQAFQPTRVGASAPQSNRIRFIRVIRGS